MLLVPPAAKVAGRVFQLFEKGGRLGRLVSGRASAPELAQPIDRDGAQPGAEGAGSAAVLELGQFADDDFENALDQVVHVGGL
jgi:hypothetical protein